MISERVIAAHLVKYILFALVKRFEKSNKLVMARAKIDNL